MNWTAFIEAAKANKDIIVKRTLIVAGATAGIILTAVLASKATDDTIPTPDDLDYIEPAEPVIDNNDN